MVLQPRWLENDGTLLTTNGLNTYKERIITASVIAAIPNQPKGLSL